MESVNDIKSALSERSRTATLDELRDEGRKRVRLIRAEHVAQMISEAVHGAIEQSGLIGSEQVEGLVEKSRQEFKTILREREEELRMSRETEERLESKEHELEALKTRFGELNRALAETRAELEESRGELEVLRERSAAGANAPAAPAPMPQNDMVMSLMQELANLKATVAAQHAAPPAAAPAAPAAAAAGGDISAALDKLAGSLNDRLESLGRKMGVSSAVEGDAQVDFSGMFEDGDSKLESNMENIQVKKKTGGGIAANLARLKKLKGGG
ncbi:MAG: hypothetical protein AB8H80_02705 [Planctomycetota bacterium]